MSSPAKNQEREHALLSASGSHKWLHCPPSARLEDQFADTGSEFAAEGTLAHKIAELKLRKHFTVMKPSAFTREMKKLKTAPLYREEMQGHTDTYLDYVQETAHAYDQTPSVAIEKRLDYSHVAPEGFGTGDCVVIGGNLLHVIDFKYGQGVPVDAAENPQAMLYGLGALAEYGMLFDIQTVRLTIVQPRLSNISWYEISAGELRAWGENIKPVAQMAFDGKGEFCAGEWCRFCRAKAQCRARTDTMTALEAFGNMKPPLITDAEVGDILRRAQTLKAWVTDLENYALSAVLAGGEIPGWKAVEGRSNRMFADTDAAFAAVKAAGYDEATLYERKPITLTAVEKLLGRQTFSDLLGSYVIKPPGKPALVPETDSREAITNKTTAAEAFRKQKEE